MNIRTDVDKTNLAIIATDWPLNTSTLIKLIFEGKNVRQQIQNFLTQLLNSKMHKDYPIRFTFVTIAVRLLPICA